MNSYHFQSWLVMLPIVLIILLAFLKKNGDLSCLLYFSITSSKGKGFVVKYKSARTGYRLEIGQKSLGTFTTRFTERVGMSPSEFRNSVQKAENHFRSLQKL